MINIDSSSWFYDFVYNGEQKRIHRFAHMPINIAIEANKSGDITVEGMFDALLRHDCGMTLSDLDSASAKLLIDELARDGEELGE